ncbi:MAG: deoxyribose-phosphate aldolase [Chitinophagaceae bacterium]
MVIAGFIDHTLLKPDARLAEIENLCHEAMNYQFAAVCVPPYYVKDASLILKNQNVKLATVIGFPFGYSHYKAKLAEAREALEEGAQELDIVMNMAAFKNNDLAYMENEIQELCLLKQYHNFKIKVIIESGVLNDEEIIKCCEIYKHFPVDFIKTSTGYAAKGATVEAVQLIRQNIPSTIKIKASGGIKTFDFACDLIKAGADRLGCSAGVAIVKGSSEDIQTSY